MPCSARSAHPDRSPRRLSGLRIDELAAGDTATVQAVFEGLSAHSRYLRFHTGVPILPSSTLRRLADVQSARHVVHVAWLKGRPVGLARWIRFPGDTLLAEIAVEVVDEAQGRGIGRALVGHAARSALAVGVEDFLAYVAVGNRVVRDWARALGAVAEPDDAGAMRLPVAVVSASTTGKGPSGNLTALHRAMRRKRCDGRVL